MKKILKITKEMRFKIYLNISLWEIQLVDKIKKELLTIKSKKRKMNLWVFKFKILKRYCR